MGVEVIRCRLNLRPQQLLNIGFLLPVAQPRVFAVFDQGAILIEQLQFGPLAGSCFLNRYFGERGSLVARSAFQCQLRRAITVELKEISKVCEADGREFLKDTISRDVEDVLGAVFHALT